ncbi:MAG TPA: DUF5615 family PIN-like protein, partial [Aggregatilineales bacterium]|nr:DUF5615 family PIN-like protein [Aggregatilineales bacterium]
MAAAIRLYLDENVSPEIARQLRLRGIEIFTTQELVVLSDSDIDHLKRAIEMECVLCTNDTDYLQMAAQGIEHCGIVFGQDAKHDIGDWVTGLELICMVYTPEDMK